jgi:autotransporter-associated beta strand protein
LQITPPIGFDATGCVGGPFSKTNETFILTNTGTNSLDWSLANPSLWLDASLGSGTLVAGGSTNVTVSLNSYAYSLTSGLYAATVWFTNLNDGVGQSRQFTLAVDLLTILSQPQSLTVSTGFPAWFSVSVSGTPPLFFQWQKDGTNLTDGGNISGSTTATLELNPTTTNDAGNYRVIITNACGKIVTSSNATLILDSVHNLIWTGYPNSTWDLNTSPDWVGPQKFNDGDNVTFDDTGSDNFDVKLVGPNLNARSVTVASQYYYDLVGTGNFNGPGILIYKGSAPGVCGPFEIDNANGYSGGTIVSNNAAELIIHNYAGLGTGPLILNCPSGGTAPYPDMEVTQVGNACVGVAGDIQVLNNFNVVFYTAGAYGGSFLGNLSGTTGKTLTISDTSDTVPTNVIVRLYGDNTVYNGNLNLSDSRIIWACYEPDGSQVYNGVISGTGSLIQGNSGLTILNGAETYTGSTIVSNGTLQINGSLNASSAVTVQSDGVLAGSGIINRPVNVLANGWIAGGAATIGTLNLGSTLTFNGGSAMARINRNGGSSQADKINVTGAINNNGVGFVVVTNQGAPLLVGDTFTLFNKGVTGGNNFIVTGAKVSWNNNLASTPATISVANTNPAVITPTLAGSTLTLSWPGYTGWILQSNMVSLLTPTNWVTVPNSAYINRINIGINYATTNVFYRLISQ